MNTQFIEMLKMKRKSMNKYQKKQSYKTKLPKMIFPSTIERRYANDIISWMKQLTNYINDTITVDLLDDWISELKVDMRQDSFQGLFSTIIGGLKEKASKLFARNEKRGIVTAWAGQISDQNQNQVQKSFEKLLGFKYIQPELWESSVIQAWSQNNYNLITSLSDDYIKNVNRIVSDGVMAGKDSRSIKKELTKLNKQVLGDKYRKVRVRDKNGKMTTVTRRVQGKAGLIARDQVASLNGQLTKRRMQEAGLDLYEWQTAGDERVRQQDPKRRDPNTYPSHRDMDGTINKWSDATVYSKDGGKTWIKRPAPMQGATPGSQIQCLPGDTEVRFNSDIIRCYRRWFTGELTEIVSSTGSVLRCTSNHPILTSRGWIAAKDLNLGENIVQTSDKIFFPTKANPQDGIASAEEIFSFFHSLNGVSITTTNGSSCQFHNDGIVNEKVDIISTNGVLLCEREFMLFKKIRKFFFSKPFIIFSSRISSTLGKFFFNIIRFFLTSLRFVSIFSKCLSFFKGGVLHSNEIPFSDRTNAGIGFGKDSSNNRSRNSIFFSTFIETEKIISVVNNDFISGEIDNFIWGNVVSVHKVNFSNYVYNFETITGYYISNTMSTKNCRCSSLAFMGEIYDIIDGEINAE